MYVFEQNLKNILGIIVQFQLPASKLIARVQALLCLGLKCGIEYAIHTLRTQYEKTDSDAIFVPVGHIWKFDLEKNFSLDFGVKCNF